MVILLIAQTNRACNMNSETIAIIDLGTNTFHLLIARIDEREDFSIVEKYKEPVKLGEGGITKGEISKAAFARGIQAMKKFRKLIVSKKASVVRAFATSAIRSASNGEEFVAQAKKESGIEIRIINGNEEASLIYDGVRNGVLLPTEEDALILDIGGGSVEFIVHRNGKAQLLRSLPIGAARMLETSSPSDPIKKGELEKVRAFLKTEISGLLTELKEFNIKTIVGSSGSFETLGAIIAHENKDTLSSENLNSYRFKSSKFKRLYSRLLKSNRNQRLDIRGMDPLRVDMIVMAGILIDLLVSELKVETMMVSTNALKEGILFRYIDEQKERMQKYIGNTSRNLRAKAVKNLCEKYHYFKDHSLQVSELAMGIFDQLRGLHPFGEVESEWLKYAALMHDIGHFINRSGHHKHGQYIIMHSGLKGFSHDEIILLGNIVRYHRKGLPTRDHFHYKVLEQRQRLLVRTLAGILRIADHLDRGHRGLVENVSVQIEGDQVTMEVKAKDVIDIELQAARDQKALFEQVFDKKLVLVQKQNA